MHSSHGHRFLREHLALPSGTTLRTKYGARISQLRDEITDRSCIETAITDYIAHYASFPEFVLCTVCIDAFTVDPNSPKPRRFVSDFDRTEKKKAPGNDSRGDNSFFLLQLTLWDRKFPVSPIHLLSAASGTASPTIRKVLDETIGKAISADSGMKIVFASVDGDEGYTFPFQ
jgi:hypothetical protein